MPTVDLAETELRALNRRLHALGSDSNETDWQVLNPRGAHALAVGLVGAHAVGRQQIAERARMRQSSVSS